VKEASFTDGFAIRTSAIHGGHQRILTYLSGNKPLKIINKLTFRWVDAGYGPDLHPESIAWRGTETGM